MCSSDLPWSRQGYRQSHEMVGEGRLAPLSGKVFAEHFDLICERFKTSEEEIAELLGETFGMLFG